MGIATCHMSNLNIGSKRPLVLVLVLLTPLLFLLMYRFHGFQENDLISHYRSTKPPIDTNIKDQNSIISSDKDLPKTSIPKPNLKKTNAPPKTVMEGKYILLNYEELIQRRNEGHLDLIPLKFLLESTNVLHEPMSPCTSNLPAIALVTSACKNSELRNAVRGTWAVEAKKHDIPVVFFVARCPTAKEEIEKYQDIVEADFVDAYVNNTLKSLARYRWYYEKCSGESDVVLFVDDDVLVDIENVLKYLSQLTEYSIICRSEKDARIRRDKNKPWYIPYWLLRDTVYPEYCNGPFYIVNGMAMGPLLQASLEMPYFSVDDVLFTGYAPGMLGLEIINDIRIGMRTQTSLDCDTLASHSYKPNELRELWKTYIAKCKR